MPQEWPFAGRLAAWRSTCDRADTPRLRAEATDAFVDRAPIDWNALLARAQTSPDRVLFEDLRLLDLMRRRSPPIQPAVATRPRPVPIVRLVIALAALQTTSSFVIVGVAFVTGQLADYRAPQIALALAFAASSFLLGASRDRRSLFLLAAFASAASAFARGSLAALPTSWSAPVDFLFRGLFPEAFVPAALWQFAVDFPRVRRFTSFDVLARRAAAAAWVLGAVLYGVNLVLAYDVIDLGPAVLLERHHPGNVFWHLFVLAVLPAMGAILVRAGRAPFAERRKVRRFASAIAIGTAPLLLCGVARMMLPRVDTWFRTAPPLERLWLDGLVVGALTAMPILTAAAVLLDRPFELGALYVWRRRFESAGVSAVVAAPFAALALTLYRLRHMALADVMSGPRMWLLPAYAAVGCMLLAIRPRLLGILERRGLRRAVDHQQRLTAALERVRLARGAREVSDVLGWELRLGLEATTARVLVPQGGSAGSAGCVFSEPFSGNSPLDPGTVLVGILGNTTGPLDLSPDGPVLALLPETDRDWVVTNGVRLAAPLKHRDGTIAAVVVVGPKRADRSFDRRDLWLAATLIAGAAAAWDADAAAETSTGALGPHSNQMGRRDEAAFECSRCGMVAEGMAPRCGCHGGMVLASLPRQLLGKFVVERRVGAGGMGVVYLARDTALDRDVALKTLPDLRDGTVARLRDEARAMAALNHESLATIFGLEIWRRTPVLVVEYFPRGTLARRLAAGPLPPADVVALGIALARALAYMHARGVLHRDLKPSNIALTATGAPKLLDFGLATFIDTSASGTDSPLGRGASFLGTPAYLPPEAFQGAPPDPAFDLWALSVVLVEAITGKKPFDRGGRGRMRQLALAVDPAGVRPSPPRSLSAFFARSLALRPESRFQTSFEMQSALEALHDPSIDLE